MHTLPQVWHTPSSTWVNSGPLKPSLTSGTFQVNGNESIALSAQRKLSRGPTKLPSLPTACCTGPWPWDRPVCRAASEGLNTGSQQGARRALQLVSSPRHDEALAITSRQESGRITSLVLEEGGKRRPFRPENTAVIYCSIADDNDLSEKLLKTENENHPELFCHAPRLGKPPLEDLRFSSFPHARRMCRALQERQARRVPGNERKAQRSRAHAGVRPGECRRHWSSGAPT